jgi:hypothetical protein
MIKISIVSGNQGTACFNRMNEKAPLYCYREPADGKMITPGVSSGAGSRLGMALAPRNHRGRSVAKGPVSVI